MCLTLSPVLPAIAKLRPAVLTFFKKTSVILSLVYLLSLLFGVLFVQDSVSCSAGWLQTGCIAKNGLEHSSPSICSPSARIASVGSHACLFVGFSVSVTYMCFWGTAWRE